MVDPQSRFCIWGVGSLFSNWFYLEQEEDKRNEADLSANSNRPY